MKFISATLFFLSSITILTAAETNWQDFMQSTSIPVLALNELSPESTSPVQQTTLKSPKKAMLFSALVPGAGQLYAGSWTKAAGFFAAEMAGWTMFAVFNQKGNQIEDDFHNYAHTHWDESYYWDWVSHHSGVVRTNMDALREWEHDNFSHGLHLVKDQQYYEMLGKYDQFNYGWDDYRSTYEISIGHSEMVHNKLRSPNRLYYEDRRDDSNKAFIKATTGTTIVLFNHIISALEAAWSTSRQNKRVQTTLRLEPLLLDTRHYTALTLRMNW